MIGKAQRFRELHEGPGPLVLPNAWDAASAALMVRCGAAAVATTSGGVAWAHGRPDGEGLTRDEMVAAVRRMVAAVDVPVSADVEGGYGDVAATVRAVIEAGAAGINLEDSRDGTLLPAAAQAERIRAARDAAAGLPMVINARTDVFLLGGGDLDDVLARGDEYAKAGADCLFVPGLLDLDVLRRLTAASPLPVNVMAGPGGPGVAELAGAGVRRISVGTAIAQAAYAVAERAARELLTTGGYRELERQVGYAELNALARRP